MIGPGQLRARQSGPEVEGAARTRCSNWATPNGGTELLQGLWENNDDDDDGDVVRIFPLFVSACCLQCCVIITLHFEAGNTFHDLLSDLFSAMRVWIGRGGHWCNVYCLCMRFRLWTCYFSWAYFVWALCFVMWVAHVVVVPCEELIQNPGKYCTVVVILKKSKWCRVGKVLQIIFLYRLHIIWLYLIASGPCQSEQYDNQPGRESMSQWGQHHSVYNTIKYSKHA